MHVFVAQIKEELSDLPSEKDLHMVDCVWMPFEMAEKQDINPEGIASSLRRIIENGETIYLGSHVIANVE